MSDQRRNEHSNSNSNGNGNSNCNSNCNGNIIRNGYMQSNYEEIGTNGNTFNRKDHRTFKDGNNVLNKGKRYRERDSDESKIIFLSLGYHHRDSRNNTVEKLDRLDRLDKVDKFENKEKLDRNQIRSKEDSANSASKDKRKKDLVRKIIENSNIIEESLKDNIYLKTCADNLKNFSIEDFGKFFQVLANMQYVCSIDSDNFLGKYKDLITINGKLINYNPERVNDLDEDYPLIDANDILKVIVKKDIPLESILKESNLNSQYDHHLSPTSNISPVIIPPMSELITFKSFFEDLLKTVKKQNEIQIPLIQNLLKIYSSFVYNNGVISFNKDDKLLLDFIIENCLLGDKIENFYVVCKYWLLQDFLNFERDIKYDYSQDTSDSLENTSRSQQLKCRYDTVLYEILNRIENHKELFDQSAWIKFIEDLPRVNEKVIENITTTSDKIIITNAERIRKDCADKKALIEILPHLKLMKNVYSKLKRPLSDRILNKFLDLTKSSDSHVIAQSIFFLKTHILPFGKYEIEKIKEFALAQFKDLLKINENTPSAENLIISKYPLYFFLIVVDKDLILQLPVVYANSHEIVRNYLNKDIGKILKGLDTYYAEKVINECSENCLPIVLFIIEGKLFNSEAMITSTRSLNDNKLLRRIKNYYNEYNYIDLLVSISDKIPLREFFKSEENFVWEKIKHFDGKKLEENAVKIFSRLNCTKNEVLFTTELSPLIGDEEKGVFKLFTDKICLYILYLIISNNEVYLNGISNHDSTLSVPTPNLMKNIYYDLNLLFKYYKLLKSEKTFDNLTNMFNVLILNYKKIEILFYLKIVELIFDIFGGKEIFSASSAQSLEKELYKGKLDNQGVDQFVIELTLSKTYNIYLLGKLKEYLNITIMKKEPSDAFINELIIFLTRLSSGQKDSIFKNLDERLKSQIRVKDFILFSDI